MIYQLEGIAKAYCATKGCTVLGPVGQGAFKETYRIELPDGRQFALKVFKPGFSPERTQREMEAITKCSHKNIGTLAGLEVFANGASSYLIAIEEFLSGGSLTTRISAGVMSRDEVELMGALLIEAVGHVASHGLVHRDLKPDNIMFRDAAMSPVVVDFGLVRDLKQQSLTVTWLMRGPGTPLFAPPEQLLNEKSLIDWRSDQFSLGVVLGYSAFGFHAYSEPADTDAQIVERVATHQGPSQRFLDAANASKLETLVKMVAPYPVQRFRTAARLASAWPRGS